MISDDLIEVELAIPLGVQFTYTSCDTFVILGWIDEDQKELGSQTFQSGQRLALQHVLS